MIKFIYTKPVNPLYRPDEVTPEEKAALFPMIESAVRIIDRAKANDNKKPSETWIEDEALNLLSFQAELPKKKEIF